MVVVVVGLSHRTATLEVLERVTVGPVLLPEALDDLSSRDHLAEAVVLSTCHRTEVYVATERFDRAVQDVRNFLSPVGFLPPVDFSEHLYTYFGEAAADHLFSVVAGIDSVVLGESEIQAQVRTAWESAHAQGAAGPVLGGLFRHALEVGKRARSETGIARHITSVSQAAVAMAAERLGDLAGRRVLVLGAGQMGERMAVALLGAGVAKLQVANRTSANAAALARRVDGRGIPIDEVPSAMADVDMLLTSTSASGLILERADLEEMVLARGDRPLLIVDVAVPRDVDPSVGRLPGVTLLDMDDLNAFVAVGIDERGREVAKVQAIIGHEVERYVARTTAREVAPLITELHGWAEGLRQGELERFKARLEGLDDRQREAVEAVTRGLVAKLLHEPTVRLKDVAGDPAATRLSDALRQLFGL